MGCTSRACFVVAASMSAVEALKDQAGLCRWNYVLRSLQQRAKSSMGSLSQAKRTSSSVDTRRGWQAAAGKAKQSEEALRTRRQQRLCLGWLKKRAMVVVDSVTDANDGNIQTQRQDIDTYGFGKQRFVDNRSERGGGGVTRGSSRAVPMELRSRVPPPAGQTQHGAALSGQERRGGSGGESQAHREVLVQAHPLGLLGSQIGALKIWLLQAGLVLGVAASMNAVEALKDQAGLCRWNYVLRSLQQSAKDNSIGSLSQAKRTSSSINTRRRG
ncbi:hypothetical protein B296_00043112 [Ensete ventricosum]|uniref:Wound-responsive family protein n=1 Tax=Ensete ventricosum TaxID=4639 RepID=A0A426XUB2_ENSVE|nr:hypothetical protein B296_00043112 [Ensete ventricosum]